MYTNQVENMLKEKVESMSIDELALKTLITREKTKLRKRKFVQNKRKERLDKNEI